MPTQSRNTSQTPLTELLGGNGEWKSGELRELKVMIFISVCVCLHVEFPGAVVTLDLNVHELTSVRQSGVVTCPPCRLHY